MRRAYSQLQEPLYENQRYLVQKGQVIRQGKVVGLEYYLQEEDEPQAIVFNNGHIQFPQEYANAPIVIRPENFEPVLELLKIWDKCRKNLGFFSSSSRGFSRPPEKCYEKPGSPLYDEECHKKTPLCKWGYTVLKPDHKICETIKQLEERALADGLIEVAGFFFNDDLGGRIFNLRGGLVAVLERYALCFCLLTEEELREGKKLPAKPLWTTLRNTDCKIGCDGKYIRLDPEALWYLPELIALAKHKLKRSRLSAFSHSRKKGDGYDRKD